MTCDNRSNIIPSSNTFNFPVNTGRARLFSTPDKQDLETIYENEANAASGNSTNDQTNTDQSQTSKKNNNDASKRSRIQAVFSNRNTPNDKKLSNNLTDSVGVISHSTHNTSGPGGGSASDSGIAKDSLRDSNQPNVVAALAQHTTAATPVATSNLLTTGRPPLVPANSLDASTLSKQSLSRRVRSRSKTDNQSISDKSLFSRIFSKKSSKKPRGALITTTTNSIDIDVKPQRVNLINKKSLTTNQTETTIDEENEYNPDDYDYDDDNALDESVNSIDCLSDIDYRKKNPSANKAKPPPYSSVLPASDSQYYASMSSAPTGFSISYHKHTSKDANNLRIQAALGRLQQQAKKGTTSGGTAQLMSLFQDPNRATSQSPTPMSGTTRIKTLSGQTIITRNSSASDRPSTYLIRSSSMSPTHDADETFVGDDEIYTHFMKCHTCYDLVPKSSKLVIFDTQLAVKKAFFALVYNGVRAAPLWDTKRQRFIGLLTITDFILILQKYYKEPHAKIEELEEHRIETWREVLREYEKPLLYIRPDQSLFDAIRILIENHVHRLPIVDPVTNNVVFILTHKRILRFFYLYIYDWPQPSYMSKTLEELNLGTYDNLHIIKESSTVIEALGYFVKYRVSALPVVDQNNNLVNIYSKFDVIGLAPDKSYRNLNMTINEALSYRKERFEAVAKCYRHESLSTCMERIVKAEVHRLVIVDSNERVIGILSLSDLLNYIVIRPTKVEQSSDRKSVV